MSAAPLAEQPTIALNDGQKASLHAILDYDPGELNYNPTGSARSTNVSVDHSFDNRHPAFPKSISRPDSESNDHFVKHELLPALKRYCQTAANGQLDIGNILSRIDQNFRRFELSKPITGEQAVAFHRNTFISIPVNEILHVGQSLDDNRPFVSYSTAQNSGRRILTDAVLDKYDGTSHSWICHFACIDDKTPETMSAGLMREIEIAAACDKLVISNGMVDTTVHGWPPTEGLRILTQGIQQLAEYNVRFCIFTNYNKALLLHRKIDTIELYSFHNGVDIGQITRVPALLLALAVYCQERDNANTTSSSATNQSGTLVAPIHNHYGAHGGTSSSGQAGQLLGSQAGGMGVGTGQVGHIAAGGMDSGAGQVGQLADIGAESDALPPPGDGHGVDVKFPQLDLDSTSQVGDADESGSTGPVDGVITERTLEASRSPLPPTPPTSPLAGTDTAAKADERSGVSDRTSLPSRSQSRPFAKRQFRSKLKTPPPPIRLLPTPDTSPDVPHHRPRVQSPPTTPDSMIEKEASGDQLGPLSLRLNWPVSHWLAGPIDIDNLHSDIIPVITGKGNPRVMSHAPTIELGELIGSGAVWETYLVNAIDYSAGGNADNVKPLAPAGARLVAKIAYPSRYARDDHDERAFAEEWSERSVRQHVLQELKILSALQDPSGTGLPKVHGVWAGHIGESYCQEEVWIVIMDHLGEPLDSNMVLTYKHDLRVRLAKAYRALHDRGVIHGDARPQNWLWDQSTRVLSLIDFGMAVRLPSRFYDWYERAYGTDDDCASADRFNSRPDEGERAKIEQEWRMVEEYVGEIPYELKYGQEL